MHGIITEWFSWRHLSINVNDEERPFTKSTLCCDRLQWICVFCIILLIQNALCLRLHRHIQLHNCIYIILFSTEQLRAICFCRSSWTKRWQSCLCAKIEFFFVYHVSWCDTDSFNYIFVNFFLKIWEETQCFDSRLMIGITIFSEMIKRNHALSTSHHWWLVTWRIISNAYTHY